MTNPNRTPGCKCESLAELRPDTHTVAVAVMCDTAHYLHPSWHSACRCHHGLTPHSAGFPWQLHYQTLKTLQAPLQFISWYHVTMQVKHQKPLIPSGKTSYHPFVRELTPKHFMTLMPSLMSCRPMLKHRLHLCLAYPLFLMLRLDILLILAFFPLLFANLHKHTVDFPTCAQ